MKENVTGRPQPLQRVGFSAHKVLQPIAPSHHQPNTMPHSTPQQQSTKRMQPRSQRKSDSKRLRDQIDAYRRRFQHNTTTKQSTSQSKQSTPVQTPERPEHDLQIHELQSALTLLSSSKNQLQHQLQQANKSNTQTKRQLSEELAKKEFLQKMVQTQQLTIQELKKEKATMQRKMQSMQHNDELLRKSFQMIQGYAIRMNSCTTKQLHKVRQSLMVDWGDLTETSNRMTQEVIEDLVEELAKEEGKGAKCQDEGAALIHTYNCLLLKELKEKGTLRLTLNQLNARYVQMMKEKEQRMQESFRQKEPVKKPQPATIRPVKRWRLFNRNK